LKYMPDELVGAGVLATGFALGAVVSAKTGAIVGCFVGVNVEGNCVGIVVDGDCVGLAVGALVSSHESTLFPNRSPKPVHKSERTLFGHEINTPP
jgi:hypothetical protein